MIITESFIMLRNAAVLLGRQMHCLIINLTLQGQLKHSKGGKSTGDITVDFLTSKNINYQGSTSYFSGFEFDDTVAPQYPSYLEPYLGELDTTGDGNGYLAEFDYSQYAGWCYTINDWWASYGASDSYPGDQITDYNTGEPVALGDVIRWHFTVYGYGADCGFPSNVMAEYMGGNLFTQEDKSDLIFALAAINDYYGNLDTDDVYETALAVAADPLASANDIAAQEAALADYIEDTFLSGGEQETPREAQDVSAVLNATMAQLAATVTEPAFGTSAGEWTVLSLARGEYFNKDNVYFTGYYNRIIEQVKEYRLKLLHIFCYLPYGIKNQFLENGITDEVNGAGTSVFLVLRTTIKLFAVINTFRSAVVQFGTAIGTI